MYRGTEESKESTLRTIKARGDQAEQTERNVHRHSRFGVIRIAVGVVSYACRWRTHGGWIRRSHRRRHRIALLLSFLREQAGFPLADFPKKRCQSARFSWAFSSLIIYEQRRRQMVGRTSACWMTTRPILTVLSGKKQISGNIEAISSPRYSSR